MTVSNATIADLLRRYAAVLSLEGADRFKVKAYRRAAQTVEDLGERVTALLERGDDLTELPAIGPALNAAITEIATTGKLDRLERSITRLSPEIAELAARPLLDPRIVRRVYKKLGIASLAELEHSLEAGQLRALGSRIEHHVRRGFDDRPRHLLCSVNHVAHSVERFLRSIPGVRKVSVAGSVRRRQDTVGDLNVLVAGARPASILGSFARFGAVLAAEPRGEHERRYRLSSGVDVLLRWTPLSQWGIALIEATGSPAHLADLESHAIAHGLATPAELRGADVDLGDEAHIYAAWKLPFIEPELREGSGEVEAAAAGRLPRLVEFTDIRGDLHMHTLASDGTNTIAQLAAAARQRGYEYIAITDHSQSLRITNGLSEKRLLEQVRAIDELNGKLDNIRLFKSAEVDILADGTLDYSDAVLKELDFTICSIHSRFALDREAQTARLLRAMDNPYFTILGHATGRLLLKRVGYEIDMERVMEHARAAGCFFEINASPDRLDLSDEHARLARDLGIKIAINTDAHSLRELDYMSAGIHQARRGWLEAADVINTLPLPQLTALWRSRRH